MMRLTWSSGTRAKQEGRDFQTVISRLSAIELVAWYRRMKHRLYHEGNIVKAELEKRGVSIHDKDQPGQLSLFGQEE